MEHFLTIVNGWKPLTIIRKCSILVVAAVLDPPLINKTYPLIFVDRVCLFVGKAKRRISKRVLQKNKAHQFFRKINIFTHTHVCISWGRKYPFFGKFDVFCFLVTPVLRFALLYYYWRINTSKTRNSPVTQCV